MRLPRRFTGPRLRATRQALGWSLSDLARAVSEPGRLVTKSRIGEFERGARPITLEMQERLKPALRRRAVEVALTGNP